MTARNRHDDVCSERGAVAIARVSNSGGLRSFILAAALLTFLWQSFVVQTHIHSHIAAVSAGAPRNPHNSNQLANGPAVPQRPASCPMCQELSQAGAYLLPSAILFKVPPSEANIALIVSALHSVQARQSHAWQSRAPPLSFEA